MKTLTDERAQLTLRLLARPELWQLWPMLPMVRDRTDGGQDLGVVLDTRSMGLVGWSSTVFTVNIFDVIANLPDGVTVMDVNDLPKEVFDCAEEIVAAGWRVD